MAVQAQYTVFDGKGEAAKQEPPNTGRDVVLGDREKCLPDTRDQGFRSEANSSIGYIVSLCVHSRPLRFTACGSHRDRNVISKTKQKKYQGILEEKFGPEAS